MDDILLSQFSFREQDSFLKSHTDGPRRDKGKLIFLLDLPDNPGAEDSISEKMWRALQQNFYNCQSDDPYFCFEESLKKVNEVIEQEGRKREQGSIGTLHAIAALLQDSTLHFSQTGMASILLKRGLHVTPISEAPEESSGFQSISSGDLLPTDMLLFSTRPLEVGSEDLITILGQKGHRAGDQLKRALKDNNMIGMLMMLQFAEPVTMTHKPLDAAIPEAKVTAVSEPKKRWEGWKNMLGFLQQKIKPETMEKAKKKLSSVGSKLGSFTSRATSLIKKPPQLNYGNARLILIGLLGFVLVVLLYFGIISKVREQGLQAAQYEDLLAQVKNNISIAENRFLIGEKSDAVTFLNKAALSLQDIETTQFYQSDVEKLKKDIGVYRDNFDAIIRVSNPTLLANLAQKQTVDAYGIIHTQDEKNYIYEPRRLFESLLDKIQEGMTIDPDEIVVSGAELQDFNALVFATQNGQMIEYSTRNGRFERAKTQDQTWKKAVDIKSYNGEYVYLLDPTSKAIWKYRRLRTGYSTASAYTQEGGLDQGVSLTIDGDVYALLRDGTILKYRKGKLLPFQMKDQPSIPLKNPSRIFTLPEANYLYVLDSGNKRVVVYSKGAQNGVSSYQKQIVFDSLKPDEIRDFYVDKDEQKIVVITADKAYIADL